MRIKKIVAVLLFFTLMSPTQSIYASDLDNNGVQLEYDKVVQVLEDAEVTYSIHIDGSVEEKVTFQDTQGNVENASKTVYPDGSFKTVLIHSDGKIEVFNGFGADYEVFLKLSNNEVIIQRDEDNHDESAIIPFGSDVIGSQFKHVYIGSPGSSTIYGSEFNKSITTASFAALLYSHIPAAPYAAIVGIAGATLGYINAMSDKPYKIVTYSYTYEVLFSYDNGYYIHCYHTSSYIYDSSNALISSIHDYYQAIGG